MEIKKYDSLKEALVKITNFDEECIFVSHLLLAGEFVELHKHSVDEYIIFDHGGACEMQMENYKAQLSPYILKTTTVFIPKGEWHSLKAITDLSYFVLRDLEPTKS